MQQSNADLPFAKPIDDEDECDASACLVQIEAEVDKLLSIRTAIRDMESRIRELEAHRKLQRLSDHVDALEKRIFKLELDADAVDTLPQLPPNSGLTLKDIQATYAETENRSHISISSPPTPPAKNVHDWLKFRFSEEHLLIRQGPDQSITPEQVASGMVPDFEPDTSSVETHPLLSISNIESLIRGLVSDPDTQRDTIGRMKEMITALQRDVPYLLPGTPLMEECE